MLLYRVQDLRTHDSYDCWLISYSFSAAHPLNTPVAMHTQHSSNHMAKRRPMLHRRTNKVNPMLRRHHRRLSLPPLPHPRRLLLLVLILPCQVQPAGSHALFHCGPVSFFFSVAQLSRMQMGINTAASGHLSHIVASGSFVIFVIALFTPRIFVFCFTTSSISGSFGCYQFSSQADAGNMSWPVLHILCTSLPALMIL
ncbi:hypothetical protein P692DRAFT_20152395 [Suillus brevipes Sb2]|nr:hypothetical protein P692DRAFT_20152395 [Suillus brevipes Sb2]